jgi:hypothetical protein
LDAFFGARPDLEADLDLSAGPADACFVDGFGWERALRFLAGEGRMILAISGV